MAVGESMTAFQSSDAIGDLVARCESLSGLFEKEGIDYCCGGRETLDDACRKKGIDVKQFLARYVLGERRAGKAECGGVHLHSSWP